MILKRSKKSSVAKQDDKGSLLILWLSIIITLTIGFYIASISYLSFPNDIVKYSGLLIFLIGIILRWTAIFQLKKAFTVDVAITKDHALKTDGLYKIIRHPSYLGLYLILFGLSLAMTNIISFLIISIIMFMTINYRIYVEEKILTEQFGESYINYKDITKKLIPWIY